MTDDPPRSRLARAAAETALVRVVHHYGQTPDFVLIGGLVPELLCSGSTRNHAGTTDIDVQVDLEIAAGAVNTQRLETALRNAEFEPDSERVWRWNADGPTAGALVKFELLADLDSEPSHRRSSSTNATVSALPTCEAPASLYGNRFDIQSVRRSATSGSTSTCR